MKFNPFQPGSIVRPGMFAGRVRELQVLERVLVQTKHGNPHHFAIVGERGIGKSSLLLFLDWCARGQISSLDSEMFQFLTVNVELEPATGYSEIIRKIGSELQRELSAHEKTKEALKKGWDFLKKMGGLWSQIQQRGRTLACAARAS